MKPQIVPKSKIPDMLSLVLYRKTAQKKVSQPVVQVMSPRINETSVRLLSESSDPLKVARVQGSQRDRVNSLAKLKSDEGLVRMRETLSQIEMSKCTFSPQTLPTTA